MCCEVVSVMIVTKVPFGEVTNIAPIMNYSSNRALNRVFTSTKRKHRTGVGKHRTLRTESVARRYTSMPQQRYTYAYSATALYLR